MTCTRCSHDPHTGLCGDYAFGVPGFPSTYVTCKCTEPATPVEAVTEGWPSPDDQQPYGSDPDRIAECCAFEGHQPWTTTGDKFHGVIRVCACGDRLYDLTDVEIPQ